MFNSAVPLVNWLFDIHPHLVTFASREQFVEGTIDSAQKGRSTKLSLSKDSPLKCVWKAS